MKYLLFEVVLSELTIRRVIGFGSFMSILEDQVKCVIGFGIGMCDIGL